MQESTQTIVTIAEKHGFAEIVQGLDEGARDPAITLGFLGDFSSGKSALINALVGIEVMPTAVEECTAAALAVAVAGQHAPSFHRVEEDGTRSPIEYAVFEEMSRGRSRGRPLAQLPPQEGFLPGFVFVDTAGLGSLVEGRRDLTLAELPLMDAAVLCVDIQKGALTASLAEFLNLPIARHLKPRFLVVLTHADLMPSAASREKVRRAVVSSFAKVVGCSETEAASRVFTASAGPDPAKRDVSELVAAMGSMVAARRSVLLRERNERAAKRVIPQIVRLLEGMKSGLGESQQDFEARSEACAHEQQRHTEERARHEQELDKARANIRRVVESTCHAHIAPLAAARDPGEIREASESFVSALAAAVSRELARFDQDFEANLGTYIPELESVVKGVNRIADFGTSIATAALTAVLLPGAGVALNAAEAAGGGVVEAGSRWFARKAVKKVEESALKKFATVLGKFVKEVNPVGVASDFVAERVKSGKLAEQMDRVAASVAGDVGRALEDHYEREHFARVDRALAAVRESMSAVERDRRRDLNERRARFASLTADIETLKLLADDPIPS